MEIPSIFGARVQSISPRPNSFQKKAQLKPVIEEKVETELISPTLKPVDATVFTGTDDLKRE